MSVWFLGSVFRSSDQPREFVKSFSNSLPFSFIYQFKHDQHLVFCYLLHVFWLPLKSPEILPQKAQLLREQPFIVCLSPSLSSSLKHSLLSFCNLILCDQGISICVLYQTYLVYIDMSVKLPQIPGRCILLPFSSTPGNPERRYLHCLSWQEGCADSYGSHSSTERKSGAVQQRC